MTQDPRAFPRWIPATIQKCFQWADDIKKLVETTLDSVQKTMAARHIPKFHLSFLDDDPQQLLTHPHEMVVRVILNSPLLPMCEERVALLQCCYLESIKRLGLFPTRNLFVSEHTKMLQEKREIGTILLKLTDCNERIHPDDVYLSSQLLLSCCSYLNDQGIIDATKISKIQQAIDTDVTHGCLRMLCIGMTLSPATIYCCHDGSTVQTTTTNDHVVTLEHLTLVLQSLQLWNILQVTLFTYISPILTHEPISNPSLFIHSPTSTTTGHCKKSCRSLSMFG